MTTEAAAVEIAVPAGGAGWRGYAVFAIVALSLIAGTAQAVMVSVALPEIMRDLDVPLRWAGWIVTAYTLSWALSAPVSGKLATELGRWQVFIGAMALFTAGSVVCVTAPNIVLLIAGRCVQGMAAGATQPGTYAILGAAFPKQRASVMGLVSAIFPVGNVIGPGLGGVLVESLGWRWTFGVVAPFAGLLTLAALAVSGRERKEPTAGLQPIDLQGIGYLAGSLSLFMFTLTELSRRGETPNLALVAAMLSVSIALGVAFVRRQLGRTAPIVDLRLLRRKEFASVAAVAFLWNFTFGGFNGFLPLYANTAYGFSLTKSGLLLTPRAAATIVVSVATSMLLPRIGYRKPIAVGMAAVAAGILTAALFPTAGGVRDVLWLGGLVAFVGAGSGLANPALSSAGLDILPDRVAAVAGVRSMFMLMGGSMSSAVVVMGVESAGDPVDGFRRVFAGMAALAALTAVLAVWVPERRR